MVDDGRRGEWNPQEYPRQELLPQEVRRGRNRTPLIIGVIIVLVLALGGLGAYLLARDDGQDSRAAYCDKLRELTNDGDLAAALAEVKQADVSSQLQELIMDAPDGIADDWNRLRDLAASPDGLNSVDVATALQAWESVQAIAKDAKSECDLPIELPDLGEL